MDDGEELLMSVDLLLLFQDEHKVVAEARLHHHPIHRPGEVDVRREEDYVLAWEEEEEDGGRIQGRLKRSRGETDFKTKRMRTNAGNTFRQDITVNKKSKY